VAALKRQRDAAREVRVDCAECHRAQISALEARLAEADVTRGSEGHDGAQVAALELVLGSEAGSRKWKPIQRWSEKF